jgi:predicted nuclease with RNAse H fold
VVWLREQGGTLRLEGSEASSEDAALFALVCRLAASDAVAVGLDAPLSYNPGGGDRPADASLRRVIVDAGLAPGSVMAPTMTRMAYLALRGVVVARGLHAVAGAPLRIVEVHPAAAMVLRGAPAGVVRRLKHSGEARHALGVWLRDQGLRGFAPASDTSSHTLAAAAAALAAWRWSHARPAWFWPAAPPHHPYDFAC